MPFEPSLWDDSDPTYAPLIERVRTKYAWRPSARYRAMGVNPARVYLPGTVGDGKDLERAAECRRLTRAMCVHIGEGEAFDEATWGWLIGKYRFDRYSPIRDVKANTREGYIWLLDRWSRAIGHMKISDLDYTTLREVQERMSEAGRSISYIHRMFAMLRTVARYGTAVKAPAARDAADLLSNMRIRVPPKRSAAPTREQVRAIIAEADASGQHGLALGILIQWTFALRGVDVFGQWLDAPGEGGIRRGREVWQDGLTAEMLEPDLSSFTKVISKTEKSMPEPMLFRLDGLVEIQTRLRLILNGRRFGPVITTERTGLPYTTESRGRAWARIRDRLGLPKGIWLMDTRAGALTEAKQMGASMTDLRDAAGHLNVSTTDRYARGRDAAVNNVVKLRGVP